MDEKKKLKIGFLVDSLIVPNRYFELIEFVSRFGRFEQPLIIYGYHRHSKNVYKIFKNINLFGVFIIIKMPFFISILRLISKVENKKLPKELKWYTKSSDIRNDKNLKFLKIEGVLSKSGMNLTINSTDKLMFKKANLDLIIRCGTGILSEEILNASKLGVLSIHNGDNRINRGVPAGFWEVLNKEPSTGFVIQKLTKELDGGEILSRGNFMTQTTWFKNRLVNQKKINFFMIKLLKEIGYTRKLPEAERTSFHDRQLYKFDYNSCILIKYIVRVWVVLVLKKVRNKFQNDAKKWQIAYSFTNSPSKSLWKYNKIKNPPGSFLADPFAVNFETRDVIFVEEYSTIEKKGKISAFEINNSGYKYLGPVLDEDYHISFPFTFVHNKKVYMVPETSSIGEIRIYECIEFPLQWKYKMTLMKEVDASDSMIVRKKGYWFLLTNICSVNNGDHLSELHVFYSKNIFSTNWKPIRNGNPVIFDSNKARNGGMYKHKGRLFRVSQFHKFGHYGYSIKINEIKSLSINGYEEEFMQSVTPRFFSNQKSIHHFHSNNILSVFDFHL
jgi:hypothetical protein